MDDQFGFITANPSVPIFIEKVDSNTGTHYIHLQATRCKNVIIYVFQVSLYFRR